MPDASFISIYLWCALGIVISVLLPIIWNAVKIYFPKPAAKAAVAGASVWDIVWPYVALGAASLLTALLLVAFLGDKLSTWQAALLAGYAWDSTLQKLNG